MQMLGKFRGKMKLTFYIFASPLFKKRFRVTVPAFVSLNYLTESSPTFKQISTPLLAGTLINIT